MSRIEMNSLHSLDHTETAVPGPSSAPSSYRDAQVWKELEAETGFASCADYLEFYKDVRPDFHDRLKQFQGLPEDLATAENNMRHLHRDGRTWIVIYDFSKQEDSQISLSLRCHCLSGTELIQALREPPDNLGVQVVLWLFEPESLNQEMADALILGLKLDPQLLEDYSNSEKKYMRSHSKGFRTSQTPKLLGISSITTLSQGFMPGEATAVPVLLVASDPFFWDTTIGKVRDAGDQKKPQFLRPAPEGERHIRKSEDHDQKKKWQGYVSLVEAFIEQVRFATPNKAFLLLAAASPLLYIEAWEVRKASDLVRDTYEKITNFRSPVWYFPDRNYKDLDQDLGRQRLKLRRTLEEAEDQVSQMFRYLGSEAHLDWSKELSYMGAKADWTTLVDEGRRLEIEVRDYMQLQVGNLALKESRRSIELSNSQIQKTKSGEL